MGNRFTNYISSLWHGINIGVRILIITVVLFLILQITEVVSFHISVNSGGLNTISGEIFLLSFWVPIVIFLLLVVLIPICFIVSLINIHEPVNGLLVLIATVVVIISINGRFYLRNKVKFKPEPDSTRCVSYNMARCKDLGKFGIELSLLKKDKDLVFTHDWLKQNLADIMPAYTNGIFVLNANLLNKKLSQTPDNVVVVFESNISYDNGNTGGPNDISTWWHYGRGSLMAFGDGRVEFVKTEDFNSLQWQP